MLPVDLEQFFSLTPCMEFYFYGEKFFMGLKIRSIIDFIVTGYSKGDIL